MKNAGKIPCIKRARRFFRKYRAPHAHPHVASISESLGIAPATTSQHLAVLRELRILGSRREGHKVFYKLLKPMLADWLIDGLTFLEEEVKSSEDLKGAFMEAKVMWKSRRSTQTIATRRNK